LINSRPIILLSSLIVSVGILVAGEPQQPSKIADLVILQVRVLDQNDRPVTDVPRSSFQVMENGKPQKIELFMNEQVPLTYGLAIDASGSLHDQFRDVMAAATNIINANTPDDETFVVRFISNDKIENVQPLTSDKKMLLDALNSFYIEGGQTALFDAIYVSADYLAKQITYETKLRRRVLVLVTDGDERNSFYKKEQLFQLLAQTDTQIFTIAMIRDVKGKQRDRAIDFLNQVAQETGGRTYYPTSARDLQRISNQIIQDIRTQYVIGYLPADNDSRIGFHKVQVSIGAQPNQEKRVAITRVGYRIPK
jgi:Ca-activated chloride channel homolog